MATILASIAIWLAISAHGVERQHVGPFATAEECHLHKLITQMRIRALANRGTPTMIGGRAWPAESIEVECLTGKHPA